MLWMWTAESRGRMARIEKKTKRYPSDLPFLGMPRKVQMEMQIEDVRVNTVIPDSVWALPGDE